MALNKRVGALLLPALVVFVLVLSGCCGQMQTVQFPSAAVSDAVPGSEAGSPAPVGPEESLSAPGSPPVASPSISAPGTAAQPSPTEPTPDVMTGSAPAVSGLSAAEPSAADPSASAESEKWYAKGMEHYNQYQFSQAVVYFDKAVAADPGNYKVYADKGVALCYLGDCTAGIAQIGKALELKPDYYPAFYSMAMAYKVLGDYDECLVWFKKNLEYCPENAWSCYGIATIYADRGDTGKALEFLKKAVELDPGIKSTAAGQEHFAAMRGMPEFQALVG